MKKNRSANCNSQAPDCSCDPSLNDIANVEAAMDIIDADDVLAFVVNLESGVTDDAPFSTADYKMLDPDDDNIANSQES